MADDLDLVLALKGGAEAIALAHPRRRVGSQVEERAQEVLGAGVLVESSREIGDRRIAIGLLHDGRVEQERAGSIAHRARLRWGHALEHLDLEHVGIGERVTHAERPGDVEEIVRGNPEAQCSRISSVDRRAEHALVRRVDVGLGVVRRLRPVVQFGLDLLHRQVGALDQADLDRCAASSMTCIGPGDEPVERSMGVGDVGLQDDAGGHVEELRLIQHADEGLDRQVEVAVLLHVEVDEGPVSPGDPVESREALGDAGERVVPGQDVEVGAQR